MKKHLVLIVRIAKILIVLFVLFIAGYFNACTFSDNKDAVSGGENSGNSKDIEAVERGRFLFTKKCMECHSLDVQLKGPALRDVTKRRKADWILKLMLNTEEMLKKDPEAAKMLKKHKVKMIVKDVNENDAKAILEYLKYISAN